MAVGGAVEVQYLDTKLIKFTNLFCRESTFCSLNFNSSANLSFSSVTFSSL